MQATRVHTGQLPKLLHVQTNIYIDLPLNRSVIHIGKPNDRIPPDIDVSNLPDSDVVSRIHAHILVQENTYLIEDLGSANGTYLNDSLLRPLTQYQLKLGDRIDLGKENQVTFLFQLSENIPPITNEAEQEEEEHVELFTKFIGLALMLGGIAFLSSSVVLGTFTVMYLPAMGSVLLVIAGVLTLTYGRDSRNLGWILITVGVVMALASGGIVLQSMTLLSFLLAFGAISAGYQLFTAGKILNYNLLSLKGIFKN
ncbi:FHA domain-containing protein [Microcoleus sp. ZQ-A2]|nr:FHA domain-containing protein [Microcoleus sp. FACHB-1]